MDCMGKKRNPADIQKQIDLHQELVINEIIEFMAPLSILSVS